MANQIQLDDEDFPIDIPTSDVYPINKRAMHGLENLREMLNRYEESKQATKPKAKQKEIKVKRAANTNGNKFSSVQEKAVEQAVNLLNAAKAAYRIVTADNKVYESENYIVSTYKRTLSKDRPYGSIAAHFKPYVENLQVGESACIPFNENIHRSVLQSAVSAWMCGHWGKGSYTTLVNKDRQHLEVLRIK